jgi:hypothetical protein
MEQNDVQGGWCEFRSWLTLPDAENGEFGEGRGLLRVKAEFWNECIIFDREIRPLREEEQPAMNHAIAEPLGLIPLSRSCRESKLFACFFNILPSQRL